MGDSDPIELPAGSVRAKLFKLGELCCDVVATIVGGNMQPEQQMVDCLQIDQRVRLERCCEHVEANDGRITVWLFSLARRRNRASYDALCEYFISKQRIGLAETPSY